MRTSLNLAENAQMALTTLRENKMRSFLTVLGVVIGITALLSVVSILVGVYGDVNAYLSDYGPNTFFIFRFDPGIHTSGLSPEERARRPLTLRGRRSHPAALPRRPRRLRQPLSRALRISAPPAAPSPPVISARKFPAWTTRLPLPPTRKSSTPARGRAASSATPKISPRRCCRHRPGHR